MCYIYNGQSEREKQKRPPRSQVHFLLQKNIGNDERQIMTSKRGYDPGAFFMPSTKAAGDDLRPKSNKRKDKTHMDYESFKEQFVEDVKDLLADWKRKQEEG